MRKGRQVGEILFMCGKAGGVSVTDEHDIAADKYCEERAREHHRRTGEWPSFDQHVDWMMEGREASERRAGMRDITDAIALLESHGYVVQPAPGGPVSGDASRG